MGITTEALKEVVKFVFENMEIEWLNGRADVRNIVSNKVLFGAENHYCSYYAYHKKHTITGRCDIITDVVGSQKRYEFLDKDFKNSANRPFQSDYVAGPIYYCFMVARNPQ